MLCCCTMFSEFDFLILLLAGGFEILRRRLSCNRVPVNPYQVTYRR